MGVAALTFGLVSASGNAASALKNAIAKTKAAEHGTNHVPDTTKRPVAKGKRIFVVSAGQVSESSRIPSDAAVKAAKVLGWKVTLLDGGLNPAKYPSLVNQAVAQGAQGIILDSIDCSTVKAPLTKAKAKKIVVVPIYAFDCNDPVGGSSSGPQLFTSCTNYANRPCNHLGDFTKGYGADQANYVIAASKNKAKVLLFNDPEYTVLKYTAIGFANTIKNSGGSKVIETVNFKVSDLLSNKLKGIVTNALLRSKSKGVNWVKSPYTGATLLGLAAAVRGQHVSTMGGEGFPDEQALLKTGAITAVSSISSEWTAWSAIDSMNSAFTHQKTHPSGIGWTIVDKKNSHVQNINYTAAYKKAWGK